MSVTEYAEKFENIVVYFGKDVYAPDEKLKVNQYVFGLRDKISHIVSQREFTTYAKLLRQFYVVEDGLEMVQEEGNQYRFAEKDQ